MCKRKIDASEDDVAYAQQSKQLKLVPFPSYDADNDVAMSDVSSSPASSFAEPMYSRSTNVSTTSYGSSAPSSPSLLTTAMHNDANLFQSPKPVGLVGCSVLGASFQHHSQNCTQIPKLRMACAAGPGRSRSMWSHCEQCGAIAMVDID